MPTIKNRADTEAKIQRDLKEYQRQNKETADGLKRERESASLKKAADSKRLAEERKKPSAEKQFVDEYKPKSIMDRLMGR